MDEYMVLDGDGNAVKTYKTLKNAIVKAEACGGTIEHGGVIVWPEERHYGALTRRMNARVKPSKAAKIVAVLDAGTMVTILDMTDDGWARTEYGYILSGEGEKTYIE